MILLPSSNSNFFLGISNYQQECLLFTPSCFAFLNSIFHGVFKSKHFISITTFSHALLFPPHLELTTGVVFATGKGRFSSSKTHSLEFISFS